jgi:hypothetical protein
MDGCLYVYVTKTQLIDGIQVITRIDCYGDDAIPFSIGTPASLPDMTTVYAHTEDELLDAIGSYTRIILDGKDYVLSDRDVNINSIENLEIVGTTGTRITTALQADVVVNIGYSDNITIKNVVIGHDLPYENWPCSAGVIRLVNSNDVLIEGCDIFGCGLLGFTAYVCNGVRFENTTIRDCSSSIGSVYDAEVVLNNCTIKGNGYDDDLRNDAAFTVYIGLLTFNNCAFTDNENPYFKGDNIDGTYQLYKTSYSSGNTRVTNSTFTGNAWQPDEPPVTPTPVPDIPGASDWAQTELKEAAALGLIPASVSEAGWTNVTTRATAMEAMAAVIEKILGKTIAQIAAENGWDLNKNQFPDTASRAVTFLKYAGVLTGSGDGDNFSPNAEYSRAQNATLVGRVAEAFFGVSAQGANPFSDDVPDWAAAYVAYAAGAGIVQGIGGGEFGAAVALENQQTAIFALRAFKSWLLAG